MRVRLRLVTLFFLLVVGFYLPGAFAAQRLISISPAATEILFALGLGDSLIADTIFCNYPEEAKAKEKIGTFSEPNIEKIVALKPDIVFATGLEQTPAVEALRRYGMKVIVSDPATIDELYVSIGEFAKITGVESAGQKLTASMKKRLELIEEKVRLIPLEKRLKVYVEIWYEPIMTAGPGSLVGEVLSRAGAINIIYDISRAYSRISPEVIVMRNPDVILLGYMTTSQTKDTIARRLGWGRMKAVRNAHIISDINPDLLLRPGPRIVDGVESLYEHLYGA